MKLQKTEAYITTKDKTIKYGSEPNVGNVYDIIKILKGPFAELESDFQLLVTRNPKAILGIRFMKGDWVYLFVSKKNETCQCMVYTGDREDLIEWVTGLKHTLDAFLYDDMRSCLISRTDDCILNKIIICK